MNSQKNKTVGPSILERDTIIGILTTYCAV
jgi:hypothetical protein